MNSKPIIAAIVMATAPWPALSAEPAPGRDADHGPFGFVRMLNALGVGSGNLEFLIDGKPVRPEGYQLGNVTGGIALIPKTHKVLFRRDGVKEGETQVMVLANDTTILIPFAEPIPVKDGEPARWEIRILKLKQLETEEKRTASFVSVSRHPELKVEIRQSGGKWEPIFVKRLAITRADIRQARGYLPVRCNNQPLSAISVGASGNFVSVLYEDEAGSLRSKNFQDYKYLSPD